LWVAGIQNEPAIATSERCLSIIDHPFIVPDKPNVATISFKEKWEIASSEHWIWIPTTIDAHSPHNFDEDATNSTAGT
jgi:hypothetical protein